MSNTVKIVSVNCQGLSDPRKRRDVFHYLRQKSYSIYLLQDTHFDPKMEDCIQAEWGYKSYFASYNSNSRGVAILFNNNLEFLVKKVYKDILGNYISVTVTIMDRDFLIVCMDLTVMIPSFTLNFKNGKRCWFWKYYYWRWLEFSLGLYIRLLQL